MMKILPILVLTLIATIDATTTIPADLRDLTRDARAIARGRVTAVDARWTDDRRTIETIVTLQAEQYVKGALGESLQFRVPGGRLGRFRSIMVGAPEFSVGQRVIVFLGARGPSVPFILGLNQGVYRLAQSSSGWNVTPPPVIPTVPVASRQTSVRAVKIVRGDPKRTLMPLADFEQSVRALVAQAQ